MSFVHSAHRFAPRRVPTMSSVWRTADSVALLCYATVIGVANVELWRWRDAWLPRRLANNECRTIAAAQPAHRPLLPLTPPHSPLDPDYTSRPSCTSHLRECNSIDSTWYDRRGTCLRLPGQTIECKRDTVHTHTIIHTT